MTSASHLPTRPARGATLIELMVGLVVCLLVSLAAVKTADLFNTIQRQGVATGTGKINALSAIAAIKEDVAAGGMGFFADGSFRCATLNLSAGNSVLANNTGFFPVKATRVGNNDQLDVVYAREVAAGAWTELTAMSDGSDATLRSMLPITTAQRPAVLLARGTEHLDLPCLVRTVTDSADPTKDIKQKLSFGADGNHNQGIFAVNPNFFEKEPVVLLDRLTWNHYALDGTDLVMQRRMDNTSAVLARHVIGFRVQYGVTNVSSAIELWKDSNDGDYATINNLNAGKVRAVRIGMVIRSPQREKEDPADNTCKASTAKPTLFGTVVEPDVGTSWRCYRYRTIEVVAPLRNLVAGTNPINWPDTKLLAP